MATPTRTKARLRSPAAPGLSLDCLLIHAPRPSSHTDSRPLFSAFALSQTPDLPSVFKPRRERTALSADELAFHRDRHASSRRLLSTWEAVARKYKDVTLEEDDEIDLWTGKIVQDRGRLRAMERARDFGAPDDDDDVPSSEITEDEESYGSGEEEEVEEERADGDEPADEDDDEDDDLGGWDESQFESPSRLISPAIAIAGTPTGGLRIHFPPPRAALSHARDELDDEDLREFLAEEERARAGRRVESNVDEEEEQQSSEIDELDALSSQSEDGRGEEMIDDKEDTPEEQGVYEEMLEEEEESDEPSDEESGEEDVFGPRYIDLSLLDQSRSGSPQRVASDSETSDDMNILSSEDESTASEDEDPDRTPRMMAGLAVTRSSCPTATNSPPSPPPSVSPPPPFQQRVPVHLAIRTKPRPPSPPRISPLKQRVLSGANQLQHVRTVPSPLRHVSYPSLPVVPAPTRAHTSALPTPPLSNASTASICSFASDRSSTPKASNQASSLCSRLPPPRLRVRFVSPSQESDDGDDDLAPLRSEHTASTPTHRTRSRLALRPLISRAFVDERKGIILLPPLPTGSSDDEEAVRTKKKAKKAATARRKDPDLFFPVRQAVVPPSLKRQDLPNGRSAEDGLPHDPSTSIVGKDDVSSGDDNMQRGHSQKRRRTSTSDTPSVTILPRDILVPSPTDSDRKFLGRLHPPTIFPAHAVLPVKKEIPLHVPLTNPTKAPPLHKLIRDTWPSVARTEPESYWREEGAIVTLDSPNLLPSVKSMAARLKLRSSVRDYHQWWEAAGGPAGAIERSRQRGELSSMPILLWRAASMLTFGSCPICSRRRKEGYVSRDPGFQ